MPCIPCGENPRRLLLFCGSSKLLQFPFQKPTTIMNRIKITWTTVSARLHKAVCFELHKRVQESHTSKAVKIQKPVQVSKKTNEEKRRDPPRICLHSLLTFSCVCKDDSKLTFYRIATKIFGNSLYAILFFFCCPASAFPKEPWHSRQFFKGGNLVIFLKGGNLVISQLFHGMSINASYSKPDTINCQMEDW